jgi:hypothetical protein
MSDFFAQRTSYSEVSRSPEFARIRDLPRRTWLTSAAEALAGYMSEQLRLPGSLATLYPWQAIALYELWQRRGLYAPLPVGSGKTLISYLAPRILQAEHAVLLIPAKLREKTHRDFAALAKEWGQVCHFIESYERISIDYAKPNWLEAYTPDLLICDEAHRLAHTHAACTRKVLRYLRARPACAFVALSGTAFGRSLQDSAHLIRAALADSAPVPRDLGTLREWSAALDVGIPEASRTKPGALATLPGAEGIDPIERARTAYKKRILETPGVVALESDRPEASLFVRGWPFHRYNAETERLFGQMRDLWIRPDETYVGDALTFRRHTYEMSLGYWGRWDPWPPVEWRQARQAWYRAVREILVANRLGIDSEGALVRTIERTSRYPEARAVLSAWRKLEPTFTITPIAVWFDDAPLRAVAERAERERMIVWSGSVPFAQALSRVSGMPYFGKQGVDERGTTIENAHTVTKGSIVASIASNGEGRNLQGKWARNLVVTWPSSGKIVEQLLGRTHRKGQKESEVDCEIWMTCEEHWKSWKQSLEDATHMRDLGGVCAKLTYCDKNVVRPESTSNRWEHG